MPCIWKLVPAAGLLALAFGSAANAADIGRRPPPPMPAPPLLQSAPSLVDEFGSGWYLRGDIGYRFNKADSVTNVVAFDVIDSEIDKSWLIGLGVGYKWEWLRADVTLDYGTRAEFNGDSLVQINDFRTKIDSFTGLANVYGDLGTWYGLTPYIGIGAGFANLQTSKFVVDSFGDPTADSTSKWNFAWAYMAGVSYKVTSNYHIDLGYRHINMGDVSTNADAFDNRLAFKKLSSDEIRLGFRYVID